jgi:DNA-binding CsgD family transcriptional regulator
MPQQAAGHPWGGPARRPAGQLWKLGAPMQMKGRRRSWIKQPPPREKAPGQEGGSPCSCPTSQGPRACVRARTRSCSAARHRDLEENLATNNLDVVKETTVHLSPRQREILSLISQDNSDKQIARRLGMSARTVDSHLQRLYVLHGVHSRAALVAKWLTEEFTAQLQLDD